MVSNTEYLLDVKKKDFFFADLAENFIFTNKIPLIFLPYTLKNSVFKKIRNQVAPSFFKFFGFYVTPALELLTGQRIVLRFNPVKNILRKEIQFELKKIFFKQKNYQFRVGRGFFFNEMLEILYLTFKLKDLNFLKRWFLLTMERIQFVKHKKFLSGFKRLLQSFSDYLIYENNVKGFFIDVRGKVGVTGDSKKRNFFVSIGKRSKTTKNSKYDYQSGVVRTTTGQLGITMIMFY